MQHFKKSIFQKLNVEISRLKCNTVSLQDILLSFKVINSMWGVLSYNVKSFEWNNHHTCKSWMLPIIHFFALHMKYYNKPTIFDYLFEWLEIFHRSKFQNIMSKNVLMWSGTFYNCIIIILLILYKDMPNSEVINSFSFLMFYTINR